MKQNPGFSSCCNDNYKPLGQSGIPWLLQAERPSDYQFFTIENRNQILRFPNGLHNCTVYWGKRVW